MTEEKYRVQPTVAGITIQTVIVKICPKVWVVTEFSVPSNYGLYVGKRLNKDMRRKLRLYDSPAEAIQKYVKSQRYEADRLLNMAKRARRRQQLASEILSDSKSDLLAETRKGKQRLASVHHYTSEGWKKWGTGDV